jgi:hypothetical protein
LPEPPTMKLSGLRSSVSVALQPVNFRRKSAVPETMGWFGFAQAAALRCHQQGAEDSPADYFPS